MGEWASSNGAFDRQRRRWQKIAMARNRTLKTHVTKSSNQSVMQTKNTMSKIKEASQIL